MPLPVQPKRIPLTSASLMGGFLRLVFGQPMEKGYRDLVINLDAVSHMVPERSEHASITVHYAEGMTASTSVRLGEQEYETLLMTAEEFWTALGDVGLPSSEVVVSHSVFMAQTRGPLTRFRMASEEGKPNSHGHFFALRWVSSIHPSKDGSAVTFSMATRRLSGVTLNMSMSEAWDVLGKLR